MDKIIILDNSERLHISNTRDMLDEIRKVRRVPQDRMESFSSPFVNGCLDKSYNRGRNQVDVEGFMHELSKSRDLHQNNADALKIVLTDLDIYSSRENTNFGFGVKFQYSPLNRYVIVSTARMRDTDHARHIIGHELGHAFGAPSPTRKDIYDCLGDHCARDDCTMHQSRNSNDSMAQARRVFEAGRLYCPRCEDDIRRYGR